MLGMSLFGEFLLYPLCPDLFESCDVPLASSDYHGARAAGLRALLVRRPGLLGAEERKKEHEDLNDIQVIHSLAELVDME